MKEFFTSTDVPETSSTAASSPAPGATPPKTYEDHGYEQAGKHAGALEGFRSAFKKFYDHFKRKEYIRQRQTEERERARVASIAALTTENQNLESRVAEAEQHTRPGLRKRVEQLLEEINRVKQNPELAGGKKDPIGYYLAMALVICLGLYLYFFYSSVIYSVLFREIRMAKDAVLATIFYSRTWSEAWNDNFFTFLIIMLAPALFLVIGFLVHKAWEAKNYVSAFGMLLLTLGLDCLMAFHIARGIEEGKAINSFKEVPHYGIGNALTDVNFWIIIALGFVTYIIWGTMFHQFMIAWQERNRLNTEINRLLARIKELNDEEEALLKQTNVWREQVRANKSRLAELEANAHPVVYSLTAFLRAASSFTHGWNRYLNAAGKPGLAREVNQLKEELVCEIVEEK